MSVSWGSTPVETKEGGLCMTLCLLLPSISPVSSDLGLVKAGYGNEGEGCEETGVENPDQESGSGGTA